MKVEISRSIPVKFAPTPEELAEVFWSCSSVEQVRFFNRLAEIADPGLFARQLQFIVDKAELTIAARQRMEDMAEYFQCLR